MRPRRWLTGWAVAVVVWLVAVRCEAQTVQMMPFSPALPKPCWPAHLLKGRDTAFLYVPCRSLDVLHPIFRAQLECMIARQKKGGWAPLVQETKRSQTLQSIYYKKKPPVTRVKDVATGFHGYGLAADVISATKGWSDPKFFYWQAQHAESCGLMAGYFWKKLPDAPHIQYAGWGNSPPLWARRLLADSLPMIWQTIKE